MSGMGANERKVEREEGHGWRTAAVRLAAVGKCGGGEVWRDGVDTKAA